MEGFVFQHHIDVIMSAMASQITSFTIVYTNVYSGADQRKHQSSASLAFVRGINRWPVNSPHKWPVTRKMFPFNDVIMNHVDQNVNRNRDVSPWPFVFRNFDIFMQFWYRPEDGYTRWPFLLLLLLLLWIAIDRSLQYVLWFHHWN